MTIFLNTMFAYLKGAFTHKTPTSLIIETGGVGYEVHISLNTYAKVESMDKGMLWVQFIVREDSQTLYGFAEMPEKELFNHLISVSGIGPNTARLILSGMTPDAVNEAILNEDDLSFKRVKGVGPKTAKRLIVELKDKVERISLEGGGVIPTHSSNTTRQEALSALVALGFQRAQIQKAMNKASGALDKEADTEAWIKASLQQLTGQR
jgi:Holliday junction DNA helicase RuvA